MLNEFSGRALCRTSRNEPTIDHLNSDQTLDTVGVHVPEEDL